MLTNDVASRMLKRFEETTQYNISIIDDNGIVRASRDKERVGSFDKNANLLITEGLPDFVYPYGFEGGEGGVILPIILGHTTVGAIEVIGDPKLVGEPTQLIKVAIEEMLEAQMRSDRRYQQNTLAGRFYEDLLYPGRSDLSHLEARALLLGYRSDCPRIPIMIVPHREQHQKIVEEMCRKYKNTTCQDIVMQLVGVQTLVFLRLKPEETICANYKEQVEAYISPILSKLESMEIRCKCFVGSIQNRLDCYHVTFQHCMWMAKHIRSSYPSYCIAFFYDHLHEYFHSMLEADEMDGVFKAYTQYQPESFWGDFIPIVEVMEKNQNNMIKSSEALHMHKNTLAYRYKQIRTRLGVDPIQNAPDNFFTSELCYYLRNR